jgi:four helix bundle protein
LSEVATEAGHLPIEEMEVFRLFDEVSDWCWNAVEAWSVLAQKTVGEQLVRAADSACANLVEGDGRFGVGDGLRFFYYSRASAREARMWLRKAGARKLISQADGAAQIAKLTKGTKLLNNLIAYRKQRGAFSIVTESFSSYDADPFTEDP